MASFNESFDALKAGFTRADLRERVMSELTFPVRRDEAWRFTSARKMIAQPPTPSYGAFGALPDGVLPLESAHAAVTANLGKVSPWQGFPGLNLAFFKDVATVHTPEGASRAVSMRLTHDGLSTPRVLVLGEPGSTTQIHLHHHVEGGLAVPVVEICALPGARVELVHVVEGEAGHFAGFVGIGSGDEAEIQVVSVLAGTDIARLDVKVSLARGARFDSSGLVLGKGKQHADHHLAIRHSGANATSTQLFRNILGGSSRAVFTGEVHVEREITGSDATQSANTLLLSDGASAVARPWLVIDNDDVVASHGATVGRLDPDALFYLRARGLGARQARQLLTRAFAGEVVETVPEAFREAIDRLVERHLEAQGT